MNNMNMLGANRNQKYTIWGTIILVIIVYLVASNLGRWMENSTNPTYNKEKYAVIENKKLSSDLLGFEINFTGNWDLMSDETYNNEYYDNLSKDRRIPKMDTTNKFIKGFIAFDNNSRNYITLGFMRMGLDYDSSKTVYDLVESLRSLKHYRIVEDPNEIIIDNKTFHTIYAEVSMNQYQNKQRWYIYQSGRMIVQIVAVSHDKIENVDTVIKRIRFK